MSATGWTPVEETSGWTPVPEPGASASTAAAQPAQQPTGAPQTPVPSATGVAGGALDQLSDFWGKLTASYNPGTAGLADQHPVAGRVAQGLDEVGGAVLGAPGMAYQAVRHPIDTAKAMGSQVAGAAKAWANPATRPTAGQIAEVGPEALGTGLGQEMAGRAGAAALTGTAHFLRFASDPVVRQTFKELSDAGSQHAAIMQGKVRTVNDLVRRPASLLQDAVMGDGGEVGQHANAVLAADEADMQQRGSQTGMADTTQAVHAARDTLKQNMGTEFGSGPIEGLLQRAMGPMSLRNLKALRTQVGKLGGALYRSGNRGEAAALYSLYDGLTDAGNARAGELGPQAASSWNHYSDVTASYKDMEKGVLGDMLDPDSHTTDTAKAGLLTKVVNNPTGLAEITRSMKKYGVDPTPLNKAVEIGQSLNEASQRTGNIVMGKIKAMIKHPLAVGVPAVASGMAGSAMGLSGGLAGFVLPIAIAYHLNGILDKIQLTKILSDVKKSTMDTSVTGELPDRMARPQIPPSTTSSTTAPPSGPPTPAAATAPVERRAPQPSEGYFGTERRQPAGSAGPIKSPKSPGEELSEQVRATQAARAAKEPRFEEGDALREIMKDPARYAKYRELRQSGEKADSKIADAMLVDQVKKMKQTVTR
jgi:hypothetical protein